MHYLHYLQHMIGPQIKPFLNSISLPDEAEQLCSSFNNWVNRVYLFYHSTHAPLADAFVKTCGNRYRMLEKKTFIQISVGVLEKRSDVARAP